MNKNNKTGYKGVTYRRGKYEAYGCLDGKIIRLGFYEDVHDAGIAASDWRLQHEAEIAEAKTRANKQRSESNIRSQQARGAADRKRAVREGKKNMGRLRISEASRKGWRKRKGLTDV